MNQNKLRLALLDMNNAYPNQSIRGLRQIVGSYSNDIEFDEFDVRAKNEVPDLSYDIYISSGGPGDPLDWNGVWDKNFFNLIDAIVAHNKSGIGRKKYVFLICHSFQLVCHHFGLGQITKRKSTSFGVFPVHKTASGKKDRLLKDLADPFSVVDSRDYQLIQPDLSVFRKRGAAILCLEKIRDHIEYERAIMAVRFSNEIIGTQFHPEADPKGMVAHFEKEETKEKIKETYGGRKLNNMIRNLDNPEKIRHTYSTFMPGFLEEAIQASKANHLESQVS